MTTTTHPRPAPWRTIDPVAVGIRIRERRVAAGLSQRQAAFRGCSAAYISRLEAGERIPSGHLLEELARRIDTTATYLATGEDVFPIYFDGATVRKAIGGSPVALGDLAQALHERVLAMGADERPEGLS